MRIALTIAGSDSGGGAGIQADLKTFHRFGVFGTTAITAITAQNTLGVTSWESVSPNLLRDQIEAVVTDLAPRAVKTGMLGSVAIVETVAACISEFKLSRYVLDPVMVATSGDLLIEDDAARMITEELAPLALLVTPNADEARVMTGITLKGVDDMKRAADHIMRKGARGVLVKGGHLPATGAEVVDLLYDGAFTEYRHPRLDTTSTHGTGCTLSAAITACLANGMNLEESVAEATDYVHDAMRTAPSMGRGHGPLNHFAGGSVLTNSVTSD